MQKHLTLLAILLTVTATATHASTYYVSSISGNDNNTGTTTSLPWQTINRVNNAVLSAGDSVLFKSSETWRGQLVPKSGTASEAIYYGAYSSGINPILLGSVEKNDTSDWIDQGANIWKCAATFSTDIGNVIFDNAAAVGVKKWTAVELQNQDDYWYDLITGEVEIYSTSNPAGIHAEIELALREHIIDQKNTGFVTYENLNLKYGGAHAFGGGNTTNITIRRCEISYIGGGDLNMDGTIRFGNGVEFWGNASNNSVEKCKIWEIYDTGVSNQNHTSTVTQQNIRYSNNLIWNCGLASFEYWNRPATSTTADIYFENNTCLYAGGGWGTQRPDFHGIHVLIDNNTAQTDTIYIRNNIFHNAQRSIYALEDNINGFLKLNYNLINQSAAADTLFVSFPSGVIHTFGAFATYSSSTGKDINSFTSAPEFVNQAALDFDLTNLSPCINNGTTVNVADDFNGIPRPHLGGYDIGAHEYNGAMNIPSKEETALLKIYPNPAAEQFRVRYSDNSGTLATLYIYNSVGQLVHAVERCNSSDEVDVNHLPTGLYSVVITLGADQQMTGKIEILR
jgi:hypothetical protein